MELRTGACYSNGLFGRNWEVRQISRLGESVVYKVLVGQGRRQRGSMPRDAFARWARYEVVRNENSWERIE